MKLPSFLASALLAAAIVFFQYILGHIDVLNLNSLYAPIAVVVINTIIKALQEWNPPQPDAATRGMESEPTPSYWKRVLYK